MKPYWPGELGISAPWQAVQAWEFFRCNVRGSNPGPWGLNRCPARAEWQLRQSRSEWQATQLSRFCRAAWPWPRTNPVEVEEPSPPVRRLSMLSPSGRFTGQRLQRAPALARPLRSLTFHPVLKFPASIQVEAVQKGCGIAGAGAAWVVLSQRAGERLHIARDHGRIEAQLDRAEEQVGSAEIATEGVAGLLEKTAPVFGIAVRPQGGDQLVTAQTAVAREGEQPKRLSLLGRTGARGAVDFY